MGSVSIVMAYYNRRSLLLNTLKTLYNSIHRPEIIIVDDGSDDANKIDDLEEWPGLSIKVIRVEPKDKTWTSACIPFNMGFREATGDIVIIQSPECLHIGDIVDYAVNNVVENKYIAFSCYSADGDKTEIINRINDYKQDTVYKILSPFVNSHPSNDGENGWYCHSEYNPNAFAFCATMTKKDLDDLGGFDERYAQGIGYEDFEFMARIRRKGMTVEIIDSPYAIHQRHIPTDYAGKKELHNRNHNIYYTGQA